MDFFVCPVCKEPLLKEEKRYVCKSSHSFDIARSGYVNLFLSQTSSKKVHGDDKMMIRARSKFLDSGEYHFLAKRLCEIASPLICDKERFLDAGCGEGYYTHFLADALRDEGKDCNIIGIDLSKDALTSASKREKDAYFAAASVYDMPIFDESVSLIWNIFAPTAAGEYRRILRKGGHFIRVYPLGDHLMGLKKMIYKTPYENLRENLHIEGLELVFSEEIRRDAVLEDSEIIDALFKMTPYYYKTSENDQKKLLGIERVETPFAFGIAVYKK